MNTVLSSAGSSGVELRNNHCLALPSKACFSHNNVLFCTRSPAYRGPNLTSRQNRQFVSLLFPPPADPYDLIEYPKNHLFRIKNAHCTDLLRLV